MIEGMHSRWLRISVTTVACFLIGFCLFITNVYLATDGDPAGLSPAAERRIGALTAVDFWSGLLALIALPVALYCLDHIRHRLGAVFIILISVLAIASTWAFPGAVVALLTAYSRGRTPTATVGTVMLAAGGVAWPVLTGTANGASPVSLAAVNMGFAIVLCAAGLLSARRRNTRQSVQRLASLNREQAARLAEKARRVERARIARELHDSIAHRLSLISVHAGVLEVSPQVAPSLIRQESALIGSTARQAVDDLHTVLTVLREDSGMPGPAALTLVSEYLSQARASGQRVACNLSDEDFDRLLASLPVVVAQTACRIVQESLTNARKHAPGQEVSIAVGRTRRAITLKISNRAPAAGEAAAGAAEGTRRGYGLVGLHERAMLLGGRLITTGPTPDHPYFALKARLPLEVTL